MLRAQNVPVVRNVHYQIFKTNLSSHICYHESILYYLHWFSGVTLSAWSSGSQFQSPDICSNHLSLKGQCANDGEPPMNGICNYTFNCQFNLLHYKYRTENSLAIKLQFMKHLYFYFRIPCTSQPKVGLDELELEPEILKGHR